MTGERLTGIDQGTLLAERMLGSRETLRALLAGGQSKEQILQEINSTLANDPVGQACFLRTIFRDLAKEGGLEVTNRRDAALAILTDDTGGNTHLIETIRLMIEANPQVVIDAYQEAVSQQTRENDPFSGSIATLLEAGKAIAPFVSQDVQRRHTLINTWKEVREQFFTVDERFHILSKIEEIKAASSPHVIFDSNVEQLRRERLTNPQIAERLGRKISDIRASARRLIAAGRIEPKRHRTRTWRFSY